MMADAAFSALTTERLVLRRFRPEDLDAFVAYRSDPQIARYQVWEAPSSPSRPSTRGMGMPPRRSAGCCTTCSSSEASIG
jgi:RimJ/RimL family protein N-acetyltransferase